MYFGVWKTATACLVLGVGMVAAFSSGADARSRSTYICFSDAKFQYGSGGIVQGTHGEGRANFFGRDATQEQKRQACIEANRQCNLILNRLKRGPDRLARRFRESDCVATGERYDRRHAGWQMGEGDNPHWVLLGHADIDPLSKQHVLRIHPDHDGRYSRIRIHILRHDVRIGKVKVVYGNGREEDWDLNKVIRDEENGPELDLRGHDRHIRKLHIEYQATNPFSHSGIQVFGFSG